MKNQNIMFTTSILRMSKARLVRSVLALGVVALIMQVSLPRAHAFDLTSLNGNYADSYGSFSPLPPQSGRPLPISTYSPFYEAGLYTFNGAGGFTARLVFNFGGGAILNVSWSQNVTGGSYTVNANGTGTISWTANDGFQRRRHFVIGAGGNELKYIGTDPNTGVVATGSMVKQ
jgi:hypothetical protein